MSILKIQQLTERIAALVRNESRNMPASQGLQPVQLEALHYLSICNRYSDTPMGVTEFLGQTKGTVSQTLKVLEKKELIRKTADSDDRRVTHLSVTAKGKKLLRETLPSPLLQAAGGRMSERELTQIAASLETLLRQIQAANGFNRFGQCADCIHNIKTPQGILCNLTQESLSVDETRLICREHEPAG